MRYLCVRSSSRGRVYLTAFSIRLKNTWRRRFAGHHDTTGSTPMFHSTRTRGDVGLKVVDDFGDHAFEREAGDLVEHAAARPGKTSGRSSIRCVIVDDADPRCAACNTLHGALSGLGATFSRSMLTKPSMCRSGARRSCETRIRKSLSSSLLSEVSSTAFCDSSSLTRRSVFPRRACVLRACRLLYRNPRHTVRRRCLTGANLFKINTRTPSGVATLASEVDGARVSSTFLCSCQ